MELREKISILRDIPAPTPGLSRDVLLSLSNGDALRINGQDYSVRECLTYQELNKKGELKKFTWREYQLINLATFEEVYLEVEDDDGLAAYLTVAKIPSGKLSAERFDKSTKELTVSGLSELFYLDDHCSARLTVNSGRQQGETEDVLLLDYESESGKTLLGVEVWEDGQCYAFTYKEVDLRNVEVLAHG